MSWFDDDKKLLTKHEQKNRDIITAQVRKIKEVGIPKQNTQIRIISETQINSFSAIEYFLLKNATIDELYLAVYRINKDTVNLLCERIESKSIKYAEILVCSFFKNVSENWFVYLGQRLSNLKNCKFASCNTHAKVSVWKKDNQYYVFEGSGNMSDNARIEQYLFEENKKVYEFHKKWISDIINCDGAVTNA